MKHTVLMILILCLVFTLFCSKEKGIRLLYNGTITKDQLFTLENIAEYEVIINNQSAGILSNIRYPDDYQDQQAIHVISEQQMEYSVELSEEETLFFETEIYHSAYFDQNFVLLEDETIEIINDEKTIIRSGIRENKLRIEHIKEEKIQHFQVPLMPNETQGEIHLMVGLGPYQEVGQSWVFPDFDSNQMEFTNIRFFVASKETIEIFNENRDCYVVKSFDLSSIPESIRETPLVVSDYDPGLDQLEEVFAISKNRSTLWIDNQGNMIKGLIEGELLNIQLKLNYIEENKVD